MCILAAEKHQPTLAALSPPGPAVRRHQRMRLVAADFFGAADTNLDEVLDIESVRPLLIALSTHERSVIALRFFDNLTQDQIA
jgi:DNA-directed RNA polymerase specialized sigma subunit